MLSRLSKQFMNFTSNTDQRIINKDTFIEFVETLFNKGLIVKHDISLLHKYISEFPISFDEFCNYIKQIYQFELEGKIRDELTELDSYVHSLVNFFHINYEDNLNSNEIFNILKFMNKASDDLQEAKERLVRGKNKITNQKEEVIRLVYTPILNNQLYYQKVNFDSSDIKPSIQKLIEDSSYTGYDMYYSIKQPQIEYEYDIVKTKKVYFIPGNLKLSYLNTRVTIEKAVCCDRDIPIETIKVPFNYFDNKILSSIHSKAEALRELILCKNYQNFIGYDDITNPDYYFYFFEYIEPMILKELITSNELEMYETSMCFIYFTKEILTSFRDLIYKCSYNFNFPILLTNINYEPLQRRLIVDVQFLNKKETIIESKEILESKLIFNLALLMIEILSISNTQLVKINKKLTNIFDEFDYFTSVNMIHNQIGEIEEFLYGQIENVTIASIIVECLLTPYKVMNNFNLYYNKKNSDFTKQNIPNHNEKEVNHIEKNQIIYELDNPDKYIAYTSYTTYDENSKLISEDQILSLNKLLFHPLFLNSDFDDEFVKFILKQS